MKNLCWIRRDLRLHDHAALSRALDAGETILLFVFDQHILQKLKNKSDARVTFIIQSLQELEKKLQQQGSSLLIRFGKPEEEVISVCEEFQINAVFTNRDYEPYAKKRDELVGRKLKQKGIEFHTFKDSVMFEKHEILTGSRSFYKVFTPYKNKWLQKFNDTAGMVSDYECGLENLSHFENKTNIIKHNWYHEIGFEFTPPCLNGGTFHAFTRLQEFEEHLSDYKEKRDFPALERTSRLSVYLRFGNISIRDMVRTAVNHSSEGSKTWLSEIIWRDFFQMILDAFPHVEKGSFKKEYDEIRFPGKEEHFQAWCEGRTGFPLIDASMRCLNQTGMMHNRLRMVVANFLCKVLLVHWRKGEQYFAQHLLDYDLAANNGGWQWCASTGADAQPYFRIFNPYTQSEKFDPEGEFIRQWLPELQQVSAKDIHRYPVPIVDYERQRLRCLELYSASLQKRK